MEFIGFYGDFMGFNADSMGFDGISREFSCSLLGFYGDFSWDLMGCHGELWLFLGAHRDKKP